MCASVYLLYTYMCMREKCMCVWERERKRKLIIFKDNGSDDIRRWGTHSIRSIFLAYGNFSSQNKNKDMPINENQKDFAEFD
jgi:hypothetical protein